ncbi:DNA-binding response regulator [Nonlabens tegetincola]|uniref:DNA-binding response regulator n=1 Tax=Nonlabens tegetincola TaxID=323273 RepID=A0A090Q1D4_9FLAO|nr:LuxR C-terminal-related transcriptional regulator [Nonlabens tegetincola]GAK96850.1 DNA-binding response regulator [Nonlabens tegetincola]
MNTNSRINAPVYGLSPSDKGIEFYADVKSHRMYFLQNGIRKSFDQLPINIAVQLLHKLGNDIKAQEDLSHLSQNEKMERFAFCLYGGVDHTPDVDENGILLESENFRCSNNCTCLAWSSKTIGDNTFKLTRREIEVLDALSTGQIDLVLIDELNISQSTLNTHRKNLFNKFNVQSTTALVMKASSLKIIQ